MRTQCCRVLARELDGLLVDVLTRRLAEHEHAGAPRAAALALAAMLSEVCFRQVSHETGVADEELADAIAEIWWRAGYVPSRS